MPEVDYITPEVMDNYIGAEIIIYHGDTVAQRSVRRRKRDVEGNTIGRANSNPILVEIPVPPVLYKSLSALQLVLGNSL